MEQKLRNETKNVKPFKTEELSSLFLLCHAFLNLEQQFNPAAFCCLLWPRGVKKL